MARQLEVNSKRATIERRLYTLNGFVEWLRQHRAINADLRVPVIKAEPDLPRCLDPDQVQRLLAHADALSDPRPGFLVRLVIETGLKRHEAVALRVGDLALSGSAPHVVVGQGVRARRVGVSEQWQPAWRAYSQQYAPVERVFDCTERMLTIVLDDLGTATHLPVTFGVLRWTCALRKWREGMPPETLRLRLGLSERAWPETFERLRKLEA